MRGNKSIENAENCDARCFTTNIGYWGCGKKGGQKLSEATCHAELRLPSNLIYLRPVRAFVKELAENMGFGHEKVNDIELAVDEVLSNAIEHGSVGQKSWIVVRCMPTDDMMRVIVSDTGNGSGSKLAWIDLWLDAVKELSTHRV